MPAPDLAERLATLQHLSGESTRTLSVLAGLSPTHLGLILARRRPTPRGDTLARLASVLGVTVDWLLSGRGPAPSSLTVRAAVAHARRGADADDDDRDRTAQVHGERPSLSPEAP